MTRYAKSITGKKEAEDATTWSALKQTIDTDSTQKHKKKKRKKVEENVPHVNQDILIDKAKKVAVSNLDVSEPDKVIKKLKKKRNKKKLVADAIKSETAKNSDSTTSAPQKSQKLGKGSLKFSKLDPELKRKQRAEVHKNRRAQCNPCFVCRSTRHYASNCPKGTGKGVGICFKCASTEHTASACPRTDIQGFPHAKCFICNEQGHLSRACPDNPRGLYPNGGACKECGEVEHFAKDCPTKQAARQRQHHNITLKSMKSGKINVEEDDMMDLNDFIKVKKEKPQLHKPKVVKF